METGESGANGVSVVKHAEEENIQEDANATIQHLFTEVKTVKEHSDKDSFATKISVQVRLRLTYSTLINAHSKCEAFLRFEITVV